MHKLETILTQHTGKVTDKWAHYIQVYGSLLSEYQSKPIALLEVGVQNGGSLEVWASFFPHAIALVGCDIDARVSSLQFSDHRIRTVIGDAAHKNTFEEIQRIVKEFDVVIDDGSHTSHDIISTFLLFFPLVSEGGVYIVEDAHCSYWAEFQGGLFFPYSAVSFFKMLVDVVNFEHWGLEREIESIFLAFSERWNVEIHSKVFEGISEITFSNSMIVIRKESSTKNLLGERLIFGMDAAIVPRSAYEDDLKFGVRPPSQASNYWSAMWRHPSEAFIEAQRDYQDSLKEIRELKNAILLQGSQISQLNAEIQKIEKSPFGVAKAAFDRLISFFRLG